MLSLPPPVSNVERQRQFRERNPGYRNRFRHRFDAAAAPLQILAEASAPPSTILADNPAADVNVAAHAVLWHAGA